MLAGAWCPAVAVPCGPAPAPAAVAEHSNATAGAHKLRIDAATVDRMVRGLQARLSAGAPLCGGEPCAADSEVMPLVMDDATLRDATAPSIIWVCILLTGAAVRGWGLLVAVRLGRKLSAATDQVETSDSPAQFL